MNFGGRSIFEKISMPFIYSTCVMDGYFMAYSLAVRCKYRTKFILLEGGLAILAFFSTGKSLLLWGIFLWIAGFLTGKQVFLNVKIHKKTLKNFLLKDKYKFIVLCLIVILLLMLMMFVRKQRNLTDILESMFSYGFGQMPCFALWFNNIDRAELQYSMGGQVFYGIMDELGFSKLASDNFPLNMELFYLGVFSNIYTVHRCVIEDFGLIGSAFFWLLFGIASGESEKKCIYGQNTLFYTVLICAFYTFIIFSFIISAWHYLTIFLAIILWGMELFYIERVHKVKLVIKGKETV